MNKLVSRIFLSIALFGLFTVTASAQATHSVWNDNQPLSARDGATGATYSAFIRGDATFAWTQGLPRAFARAHVRVTPALNYDFMLVSIISTNNDEIRGRWVVRRNGAVVCNNCLGRAYGLSQPAAPANYFKIYVGTPAMYAERWHYSGYITRRFDF